MGKTFRLSATVFVTIVGLLVVTFLIGRVVPGDPVLAVVGDRASQSTYGRVFIELGLDRTPYAQFGLYMEKALTGDFGESVLTKRPILDDLLRVFPATVELVTVGIIIGTLFGIPVGVWAAVRQGKLVDQIVRILELVGYSAPIFLDEPTLALDASIQAEVLNLLDRLRAGRGLTYVLVSHDLAVVSHMCDRLMVMRDGQVIEQLTRHALQEHNTKNAYTGNLLTASEGFTRDPALH
ncbi:hypothetical protein [uncultured Hoeflea sp.]|uniref:hypothetical protein n=1 Tax=uncultured Hoeflea sp. TaxID=538666 RepID=UPI0031F2E238